MLTFAPAVPGRMLSYLPGRCPTYIFDAVSIPSHAAAISSTFRLSQELQIAHSEGPRAGDAGAYCELLGGECDERRKVEVSVFGRGWLSWEMDILKPNNFYLA